MCGICGLWSASGVEQQVLVKMVDAIHHRGPDDSGFYVNGPVGLGNARLSIIDIEGGKQPIANEDETLWVVFNGEIYNHPQLRQQLLGKGHTFKTRSDTEVIVHLYEEHGVDCVQHLRGMFAFALWDENRQQLLLARDPLGQKPVYYRHHSNGSFAFASEVKALLQQQSTSPGINLRAMHHYISLRYVPGDDTLFEGINKLPAGHRLIFNNGRAMVEPYWSLHYEPKLSLSEEDATAQLRQLLIETVECHMLSDVPIGTFLSGGIDSTLITALVCRLSTQKISTFSLGVKTQAFNELPYARLVADRYRTEHHELTVDPDVVATLPDMLWHIEEPVDPFAFGVYSVAQLASQYVKVVLGGDGGDELFGGYDRYAGHQIVDLYCMLPGPLRRQILEPIIQRLPDNFSYNNRVQKLRWLVAMSQTEAGERYAQSLSFLRFSHEHKQTVYSDWLWQQVNEENSVDVLLYHFNAANAEHIIDKMLYTDVKTRLPDHLLKIADSMTMAHSIEARSPYVDQKLTEFVARFPAQFKINGRRLKHIQREVAREYLPEALIDLPKKGFSFPLAYWFQNELKGLMTNIINQSQLVAAGYFQREGLTQLLEEHVQGRTDHNYRLWLVLNLELWHRLFIDGLEEDELKAFLSDSFHQKPVEPARVVAM